MVPTTQPDRALIASTSLAGATAEIQVMHFRCPLQPSLSTGDAAD